MTYQSGFSSLSSDEIQLLHAAGNEELRSDWLDWLALLHGALALYSSSAPRPGVVDEEELASAMEAKLERLSATPLYDRMVLNMWSLDTVRRLIHRLGASEQVAEVADAYLGDVVEQYNLVRSYSRARSFERSVREFEVSQSRRRSIGGR